jgi:peptide/nickel transport system ATP-binding protein
MNVAFAPSTSAAPADTEPLLRVSELTTEVLTAAGPRIVVGQLSFDVGKAEILSIIGESGSGKSVAMRSLVGLLPQPPLLVTRGIARFEGRDLLTMPPAELRSVRGRRIGMIFQEPMSALNPAMSVGDQIAEPLVEHFGTDWRTARAEAVRLLDRARIPDAAARARLAPAELSGGMRQRVVIAAALACKPSLIIADEPTTALDASVQSEILGLLRELQREVGCSVILITHDMSVVRQVADRVLVMRNGRGVEQGTCADILTAPHAAYTQALVAASLPLTIDPPEIVAIDAGTDALTVKDLVVSFPREHRLFAIRKSERLFALDGVSFSLARGETLALVGESGSGKTTLARAILGLVPVEDGRIWLDGTDLVERPSAASGAVQYVFQDPQTSLDPRWPVWRSATEPLRLAGRSSDLRANAARLFAEVGLNDSHLDRFPHQLSGGQRQRVGIARALSVSPSLVIADEAVSALDATTRLQVLDLLQAIQRRTGVPFLFITHDLAVVSRIAQRVAVMRFGRLVELGPVARVLSAPAHPYTRSLIDAALGKVAAPLPDGGHRIGPSGSRRTWSTMLKIAPGHFVAR